MGVVIVDYGVGNLRSVQKACEHLGAEATVAGDARAVASASRVILPGVGAFAEGMNRLRAAGLDEALLAVAGRGVPLLGICLGMQMLFARSAEGEWDGQGGGLALIDAHIARLDAPGLKVPQMGWNRLDITTREAPCPLLAGLPDRPYMYFVHSYCAPDISPEYTAATACYGRPFTAALWRGNLFGVQFHPEKSGAAGLRLLQNFLLH